MAPGLEGMRRVGNLWHRVVSFENLWKAARKARRRKRLRPTTAAFDLELERELGEKTYRPGPYCEFWIWDPKPRKISAAPYRDRVAHHAAARFIEPVLHAEGGLRTGGAG